MRAYGQRDYPLALWWLYQLLEDEPDYPPALYQAATAHFRLRRYGDCALLLERFLEAVPHEVGATQALGHSLYSLGRYEEARAHYERVLAAQPEAAEALRGLALAHLRLGDEARALELLERVLALRPEHADAQNWIAQIHFDAGRAAEARAACERAIELDRSDPRPWFLLAAIHGEAGEASAAAEARARFETLSRLEQERLALEGVLLQSPLDALSLARLADVHVRRGDAPGAVEAVERLLALDPEDLGARILALDVMEALGQADGARRRALELEAHCSEHVEAWERLERYWAGAGDITRQITAGERHRRMRAEGAPSGGGH
jgi:tetratricopeptide (TPR) repeat protein